MNHCPECGKKMERTDSKCPDCKSKPAPPIGWVCPVCGRGNSPFSMTCICKDQIFIA